MCCRHQVLALLVQKYLLYCGLGGAYLLARSLHASRPHTTICYVCVLILLSLCPHTAICVCILLYMCPQTTTCVLILLHMCPHTTICVSPYYYICVPILLFMCPQTTVSPHTTIYGACLRKVARCAAGLKKNLEQQ
jgi:hypothetical protein